MPCVSPVSCFNVDAENRRLDGKTAPCEQGARLLDSEIPSLLRALDGVKRHNVHIAAFRVQGSGIKAGKRTVRSGFGQYKTRL
jgi:hypothetical protein